jgi:hypothetical protein
MVLEFFPPPTTDQEPGRRPLAAIFMFLVNIPEELDNSSGCCVPVIERVDLINAVPS